MRENLNGADSSSCVHELVARSEGSAPSLAEFEGVDDHELIKEFRVFEENLDAFNVMLSHRVRNHRELPEIDSGTDTMGACVLFEFGDDPKDLDITVFDPGEQDHAILSYANAEDQLAFEVGHVAPILVSVSSMDKLKIAYQTFFLDCSPYVELLKRLISTR